MARATTVDQKVRERLGSIQPANGFATNVKSVKGPFDRVDDRLGRPYAQFKVAADTRTGKAGRQVSRMRTYLIELIFGSQVTEQELNDAGLDLQRCFGFDEIDVDKQFPGLVADEDEIGFEYPEQGAQSTRLTFTFSVIYIETYR